MLSRFRRRKSPLPPPRHKKRVTSSRCPVKACLLPPPARRAQLLHRSPTDGHGLMIVDAAVSAAAIQAASAAGADAVGVSDAGGAMIAEIAVTAIIITADGIFRLRNMHRPAPTKIARQSRCLKATHP